ncbi:MAG TPA: outer membrane protein assembly factor BamB, partial [Burkholderiales bacterium]|nr:outer membrane protein assembly factor BamB [Burkholderiales bacterium]
ALVAAALAAVACSSPSGPKPAELQRLEKPQEVRVLWSARIGSADRFVFFPAPVGNAVFAAARDGTVVRLDAAARGAERWRVALEKRLSAGVAANEGTVVVATEDGDVFALSAADGKQRWRSRVSSEVLAPAALANGLVIVRSVDNRIFAFDEQDGKRRWVYQRAPASLIVRSPAGVTVVGETAFAGFSGGKLAAIALSNGGVRWESTVAVPKGATELERVTDVVGEPVVQGREVCAAAYQGRVACFDMASGRQVWTRELSSLTGVAVDARYAFVSDDRGSVHELDRTNGRSVWKQDKLAYRQLSVPAPVGNVVAVGDLEGYVHFLSRESGAFVARYSSGGGPVRAAPLAFASSVLIQTQDGTLVALAL